jgi:hypothetical protein
LLFSRMPHAPWVCGGGAQTAGEVLELVPQTVLQLVHRLLEIARGRVGVGTQAVAAQQQGGLGQRGLPHRRVGQPLKLDAGEQHRPWRVPGQVGDLAACVVPRTAAEAVRAGHDLHLEVAHLLAS